MTRPTVRLVKYMGTVNNRGATHLALLRKIVKESLPREDIQIGRELIYDAQLEGSKKFDHDSNLFSLSVTAFMHPPIEIDS
jgi:hypothetical protein